jgi:hypothetical protein
MEPNKALVIKVKFRKKIYEVETTKDGDVDEIQAIVYSLTNVNPSKQKLMFKGKILKSGNTLEAFKIKKSVVNMLLMGTPDDKVRIFKSIKLRTRRDTRSKLN